MLATSKTANIILEEIPRVNDNSCTHTTATYSRSCQMVCSGENDCSVSLMLCASGKNVRRNIFKYR